MGYFSQFRQNIFMVYYPQWMSIVLLHEELVPPRDQIPVLKSRMPASISDLFHRKECASILQLAI